MVWHDDGKQSDQASTTTYQLWTGAGRSLKMEGYIQQGSSLASTKIDNTCDFSCSSIRDGIG